MKPLCERLLSCRGEGQEDIMTISRVTGARCSEMTVMTKVSSTERRTSRIPVLDFTNNFLLDRH